MFSVRCITVPYPQILSFPYYPANKEEEEEEAENEKKKKSSSCVWTVLNVLQLVVQRCSQRSFHVFQSFYANRFTVIILSQHRLYDHRALARGVSRSTPTVSDRQPTGVCFGCGRRPAHPTQTRGRPAAPRPCTGSAPFRLISLGSGAIRGSGGGPTALQEPTRASASLGPANGATTASSDISG